MARQTTKYSESNSTKRTPRAGDATATFRSAFDALLADNKLGANSRGGTARSAGDYLARNANPTRNVR